MLRTIIMMVVMIFTVMVMMMKTFIVMVMFSMNIYSEDNGIFTIVLIVQRTQL